MGFDLIGVRHSSMTAPGGIADAIRVLRQAGLAERAAEHGDVVDRGDLELSAGAKERGPSGLLGEAALESLLVATREAVAAGLRRGRRPLLVGGDCPVLLGALAAGRERHGGCGLLLVDGHEDAWPPQRSPTGEASDSEVGIALGLFEGLPESIERLLPLLGGSQLAVLGARDRDEIEAAGVASPAATAASFEDDAAIRANGAAASAERAIAALSKSAARFWLHVDLDVLGADALPAVDYPQPGGLDWAQLSEIAARALAAPACLGCSVVIYNPDLDPDREGAERIVAFIGDLVAAAPGSAPGAA